MLCGYIASSADGFVADAEGGVGYLDAFHDVDYGYDAFYTGVDALVMGRATYDQVIGFDRSWPYPGKPCHIVTSTDLLHPPKGVSRWLGGLSDYATAMRETCAWVVGGARLQADFIAAGLLDRLQLFIVPILLGCGIPLFPHSGRAISLTLSTSTTFDKGLIGLDYRLKGHAYV